MVRAGARFHRNDCGIELGDYCNKFCPTNSLRHDNPAGSDSVHMENLFCQIDREQLHGYCLLLSVEP